MNAYNNLNMARAITNFFFTIFILTLPLGTRIILFPQKVEYLGFSIYFSEIFLFLAIGLWFYYFYKEVKFPRFFYLFIFYFLAIVLFSPDKIAAFRIWLYFLEGAFIFVFLCAHRARAKLFASAFIASISTVSLFAIFQFANLGSSASKWIGLAERSASNLGDSVVEVGERFLRAYGTFPHPNIFGGFLVLTILLTAIFFIKISQAKRLFLYFLCGLNLLALVLTFSRSAWIALFFGIGFFLFRFYKNLEARKFCGFLILLSIIFGAIFFPLIKSRAFASGRVERFSIVERSAGIKEGLEIFKEHKIFGAGLGNYIFYLQKKNLGAPLYFYQPPHNIFLLALSELGIFGIFIFIFLLRFLWKVGKNKEILLMLLIIAFLDHYLWTLYSGVMLFYLGSSFSALDFE